jgi:hypothetical protein
LPDRVFGRSLTKCMTAGRAIVPSWGEVKRRVKLRFSTAFFLLQGTSTEPSRLRFHSIVIIRSSRWLPAWCVPRHDTGKHSSVVRSCLLMHAFSKYREVALSHIPTVSSVRWRICIPNESNWSRGVICVG